MRINVTDFDLAATLECGQAFRWRRDPDGWFTGVVGRELWRVRQAGALVEWEAAGPSAEPSPRAARARREKSAPSPVSCASASRAERFRRYFALDVSLPEVVASFPPGAALRQAVERHRGLRVLRQEPWETLASFLASSTKQIVQVRQIVASLAHRFGEPLGAGHFCFPAASVIARARLRDLQACRLGFRAESLRAAARAVDSGELDFSGLRRLEYDRALQELTRLHGVGEKIANCTLLFGCGFDQAFPVDVWVERALRRWYFAGCHVAGRRLREFARSRFGPYGGWAQQYLFLDERTSGRQALLDGGA